MRKETVFAVALVGAVVIVIAGWFLLRSDGREEVPAEPAIVEPAEWTEPEPLPGQEVPDQEWDEEPAPPEVTRIIIDEPGNGQSDISEILSEKILLDEEVVDKKKLEYP